MKLLVTGGAGYIGAHVVRLLRQRGDDAVVIDDLVTGSAERIGDIPLVRLDLSAADAAERIAAVLAEHACDAVIHFAARKQVAESIRRPAWYYQQNIGGLANVLMAMESVGVGRLVFSSSAAVYASAPGAVTEEESTRPANPYGETKLVGEQLIAAAAAANGLDAVSLRYFNVAGAGWPDLGDTAALNLVPMAFARIDDGLPPVIFGDDYDTADGTCVRDYVHVLDVAQAHLAALDALDALGPGNHVFNVGTGVGASVREVMDMVAKVVPGAPQAHVMPRREGDAAVVVAAVERVHEQIGWAARYSLDDIVASAWASHRVLFPSATQ